MRVKVSFGILVAAAAVTLGSARTGFAQSVLIDFGSATSFRGVSVPAPDLNGHYWNSMQPGIFYENLVDMSNVPTPLKLGFDTPVGTDSYNGPAGPTSFPNPTPAELAAVDVDFAALGDLGVKEAVIDYAAGPNGDDARCRFQIQGLDASKTYTLKLFGSHEFSSDDKTVYSIYTDNTYSTVVASQTLAVDNAAEPWHHNRDQIATFTGVAPQTDNILYIEFVGAGGNLGYLNAMQLIGSNVDPGFVKGDFNGDGGFDVSDIDGFVAALSEGDPFAQFIADSNAAFLATYGASLSTGAVNTLGDFNGDGGLDVSDIDGFVEALANGRGTSPGAIPEPSCAGLLAVPSGLLLRRRRA